MVDVNKKLPCGSKLPVCMCVWAAASQLGSEVTTSAFQEEQAQKHG